MDIDNLRDIRGLVITIIKDEFKFWKHYLGQVVDNNDSLSLGRVQVTIPELGFFSQDQAIWAAPRQGNSLSVPLKDEWVEIYFIGGDSNRPVYLHYANEVQGHTPESYTGTEDRVIFESPKTGEYIKYNDEDKSLEISFSGNINITSNGEVNISNASKINLIGATEAFVNGTSHQTALLNLCTAIAAISPAGSSAANITAILAAFATFSGTLSTMLSIKIKGE